MARPRATWNLKFKDLCNGTRPGYACDKLVNLMEDTEDSGVKVGMTLNDATDTLIEHVINCIEDIERERRCEVEKFYIGKTYVDESKKSQKFDHMDRSTWNVKGISKRFRCHRKRSHGRDGMVVLTVVTREAIPPNIHKNKERVTPELYALALENRLIQHFLIEDDDQRIANDTINPGATNSNSSIGYALYMTFTLVKDSNGSRLERTNSKCRTEPDENISFQNDDEVGEISDLRYDSDILTPGPVSTPLPNGLNEPDEDCESDDYMQERSDSERDNYSNSMEDVPLYSISSRDEYIMHTETVNQETDPGLQLFSHGEEDKDNITGSLVSSNDSDDRVSKNDESEYSTDKSRESDSDSECDSKMFVYVDLSSNNSSISGGDESTMQRSSDSEGSTVDSPIVAEPPPFYGQGKEDQTGALASISSNDKDAFDNVSDNDESEYSTIDESGESMQVDSDSESTTDSDM